MIIATELGKHWHHEAYKCPMCGQVSEFQFTTQLGGDKYPCPTQCKNADCKFNFKGVDDTDRCKSCAKTVDCISEYAVLTEIKDHVFTNLRGLW